MLDAHLVGARFDAQLDAPPARLVQLDDQLPRGVADEEPAFQILAEHERRAGLAQSVITTSPVPDRLMSYDGCCAPPLVSTVRPSVSLNANWYASFSVTLPSPDRSAAPRNPEIR